MPFYARTTRIPPTRIRSTPRTLRSPTPWATGPKTPRRSIVRPKTSWEAITSESVCASPPRFAASTMLPRINAPSNPDARAHSRARPVASGLAAKRAQANPARAVAAPEVPIRAPRPRSRNPIELTTTCKAMATPAVTARINAGLIRFLLLVGSRHENYNGPLHRPARVPELRRAGRRRLRLASLCVPEVQRTGQARHGGRGRGLGRGGSAALALRLQLTARGLPNRLRRGRG